jgi:hypothetical protein
VRAERRRLVEDLYARFVADDFDAIAAHLDSEAEFVNPDNAIEPGVRRGPEAFLHALRRLHDGSSSGGDRIRRLSWFSDTAEARGTFLGSGDSTP